MKVQNETITVTTAKEFEIINITSKIIPFITKLAVKNGSLNIFSKHTTLAIKINEDEPLLLKDIETFLEKVVSKKEKYLHDNLKLRKNCPADEPANARGHLQNLFLEHSQQIPIIDGKLQLGQYQQIFAIETSGPREREIMLQAIGE